MQRIETRDIKTANGKRTLLIQSRYWAIGQHGERVVVDKESGRLFIFIDEHKTEVWETGRNARDELLVETENYEGALKYVAGICDNVTKVIIGETEVSVWRDFLNEKKRNLFIYVSGELPENIIVTTENPKKKENP